MRQVCPLYPQKQTFSEAAFVSAKCQKRTLKTGEGITPDCNLEPGIASWGRPQPGTSSPQIKAYSANPGA